MAHSDCPGAVAASIRRGLRVAAVAEHAEPMRAYMKSEMPFLGVKAPARRDVVRDAVRAHGDASPQCFVQAAMGLWRNAGHREERYAAVDLLQRRAVLRSLDADDLPFAEEMIRTGAWWDHVDAVAAHVVGELLKRRPESMRPVLDAWSRDDDIWIRRSAILAQLRFGPDTDETALERWIEPSLGRSEFFLAKAIGWALREVSKHDAEWVREYLARTRERLAPLSVREASKYV